MSYDYTLCDNAQCRLHDKCQRYALWQMWLADKSRNKPPQVSMLLHAADEPMDDDCKLFWQITTLINQTEYGNEIQNQEKENN